MKSFMQIKTWRGLLTYPFLATLTSLSLAQEQAGEANQNDSTGVPSMGQLDTSVVEGGLNLFAVDPVPLPDPVIVNQTVETATRVETAIKDTSVAIGVITQDEISRLAPLSFDDLIRSQPNVEFLGGPRYLGEQLVIRGESGNSVTVRIDDARQNYVSGHAGQRFFVETDFLDTVEILRGAGSFLYGSGSAGVVNISTLDPTDIALEEGSLGLRMRNTFHTNSDEWANSIIGAGVGEKVQFLAGYSDRSGNDIRLGDGTKLASSSIDRQSALGKLVITPNDEHRFEFAVNEYTSVDRGGANPQALAVGTTSNALVDRTINYTQWTGDWNWNPIDNDAIDLKATFYYNTTKQTRNYAATGGSNAGRSNIHELDVYGLDISNRSMVYLGNREHELIYGLDFYHEKQDGTETRATFFVPGAPGNSSGRPDAEADNVGIYATDRVELSDSLTLSAGLRYDTYSNEKIVGNITSQSDGALSPQISFDYEINENLTIFGQYSKGFTVPTLNDLYQDGSHFGVVPSGTLPFFQSIRDPLPAVGDPPIFTPIGSPLPQPGLTNVNYFEEVFITNPNLKPEESDNFELGIHFEEEDFYGGQLSARFTGFYKRGKNTFDSEVVGSTTTGGFAGFANPENVDAVNIPQFVPGSVPPVLTGFLTPFSGLIFDGQLEQAFRQTVNRSETEIYGFEFTVDYDRDFWFANMSLGMLRGQDLTTGLALNSITGDQLSTTIGIRPLESLEIGVYGIWNGGRGDLVSGSLSQTAAYDIYGAFLGLQISENWLLRAGVDNAFDQDYQRTNTALGEPGRNVFISSTLHF
jgi:hemoglobin/transferrin/lactoferrin receptor protein